MKTSILFFLLFFSISTMLSAQINIGTDIEGEAAGDEFGGDICFSADGNRLAIAARLNDDGGENAGHVRIFDWDGTDWVQVGSAINGAAEGDLLKSISLSADGNRIATGSYENDDGGEDAGHVRIFDWDGTDWVQAGSTLVGAAAGDYFGFSVALSGDGNRLAVGALYYDTDVENVGALNIYEWNGVDWFVSGTNDLITGVYTDDNMGIQVAMTPDGNRIAVTSASLEFPNSYHRANVRIFEFTDDSFWTQIGGTLNASNNSESFGRALAWSGDGSRLAIGSSHQLALPGSAGIGLGKAKVYQWFGQNWIVIGQTLTGQPYTQLGTSIALSADGNTLAVGAVFGNPNTTPFDNSGQTYLYKFGSSNQWESFGNIINGLGVNDRSSEGIALSPDGNRIAVGSTWNDNAGENAGHVRVFKIGETPTAVEEEEITTLVSVYPNPTANSVQIDLGATYQKIIVTVRNSAKQMLFQQEFNRTNRINLDWKGGAGIYFLELLVEDKKRKTIPVVKN